jgi:hypothetical protein
MRVAATPLPLALLDGCGGSDFDHSARTDKAIALQVDVGHSGVSGVAAAAAPAAWKAAFAGRLSYPPIAGAKLSVVEAADFRIGNVPGLHALDRAPARNTLTAIRLVP